MKAIGGNSRQLKAIQWNRGKEMRRQLEVKK